MIAQLEGLSFEVPEGFNLSAQDDLPKSTSVESGKLVATMIKTGLLRSDKEFLSPDPCDLDTMAYPMSISVMLLPINGWDPLDYVEKAGRNLADASKGATLEESGWIQDIRPGAALARVELDSRVPLCMWLSAFVREKDLVLVNMAASKDQWEQAHNVLCRFLSSMS